MTDLERAKRILKEEDKSLVIVKNGRIIFCSESPGIKGILEAIEKLGERLSGASAADRIVGKAAALLLAYSQIVKVYAITLSRSGLYTLRKNSIPVEYDYLVPEILDKNKKDICPFEKFTSDIESPSLAFVKLKAYMENLQKSKKT
ncbi:DUF1893 domain-containing protein [Candidatus Bathyarchaeota archaeon]|nr:MAG: DUF1893 domain-containing protein [Candidatus Bathyarchaeota archaeon]